MKTDVRKVLLRVVLLNAKDKDPALEGFKNNTEC